MLGINSNNVSNSQKINTPSFKGFLRVPTVNKIKNGAKEVIDEFVLNTDNIVEMTPLLKDRTLGKYNAFGAVIKTKIGEILEIPVLKSQGHIEEIKRLNLIERQGGGVLGEIKQQGFLYEDILDALKDAVKNGLGQVK